MEQTDSPEVREFANWLLQADGDPYERGRQIATMVRNKWPHLPGPTDAEVVGLAEAECLGLARQFYNTTHKTP